MFNSQELSTSRRYAVIDAKCCRWLDSILESKFTIKENRCIIGVIKKLLQECPELLDEYRGRYLAFKNNGELCDHCYMKPDDAADDGLVGVYIFFVPTHDKYCDHAMMFNNNNILDSCSIEVSRMDNAHAEL